MASALGGATTDADSRRGRPPGSNRGHSTRSTRRSRVEALAGASGVDDRSARSCDDAADDCACAGSAGPRRWSRRSPGSQPWRVRSPRTARSRPSRRRPASLLLGWTFEPLPTLGILVVVGWWWWAVRRVNTVHPANPVPRRRSVAFYGGIAGARVRAAVGDRALRHDALLGPHGPARPADAGRRAAAGPVRADHPAAAPELVGDAPSLAPAGPPFAGRPVHGLPGHGLGDVRGDDVGGPLLAAVQRVARGPDRPRPRARPVPDRRAPVLVAGGRPRSRRRGGWAIRRGSATCSPR